MIVARLFNYDTREELTWTGYFKCCPRIGECVEEEGVIYTVLQVMHSNAHGLMIYLQTVDEYNKKLNRSRK